VLQEHSHDVYSALFASEIEPLVPTSPYCVVHVIPSVKRKGDGETVNKHGKLKASLEVGRGFSVTLFRFKGDSSHNELHDQFRDHWESATISPNRRLRVTLFIFENMLQIICDALKTIGPDGCRQHS
jgi:hypothetical protein